ncbi:hypothetical protein N473_21115 [Pseudoalteromonas luteoviolacea CPMOR-1]|uniref:DUF1496 domain-containing protein n=1 Tax=Pseudoalteromonas luteoviolacea CPMOR-1 TaxID=1365248 RepID=A0A162C4P3_9GAMM|nr:hypothetical protein [Pseudoalteromonas luteoviolacea]KZN62047.1 hypothetical protein N473_21115 [Pseudoalteromonas luteoviolacea CPMOR-1]
MKKPIFLALFTLIVFTTSLFADARSSTYVLCYKQNKVAWSEEYYDPRSVQSAYYRCVNEGGAPQLVIY